MDLIIDCLVNKNVETTTKKAGRISGRLFCQKNSIFYLLSSVEVLVCDLEVVEERVAVEGFAEEERLVGADLVTWALVLRCSPLWRLYCWRSRSDLEVDVAAGRVVVVVAGLVEAGCWVACPVVVFSICCHSWSVRRYTFPSLSVYTLFRVDCRVTVFVLVDRLGVEGCVVVVLVVDGRVDGCVVVGLVDVEGLVEGWVVVCLDVDWVVCRVVEGLVEVDWRVDVCVDVRVPVVPASVRFVFKEGRDASEGPATRRLDSTPVLCW
jgi:hypothetical protein